MNPWGTYESRIAARGGNIRGAALQREKRFLTSKIPGSLSYHHLTINGDERDVAVINSDNLDTKTICSMPGEDISHGGLVHWMDNYWLVTQRDANNEVYTKATMRQCNYLLKWVDDENNIIQRWCIIEDGTKYLTGEWGDNEYVLNRGDSRIAMIIGKDKDTLKLNRKNRFLIDDYGSPNILAYRLTKPFKLGGSYNENGILAYVLTECNTEDSDNFEKHIANYYDHFPWKKHEDRDCDHRVPPDGDADDVRPPKPDVPEEDGRKVWL